MRCTDFRGLPSSLSALHYGVEHQHKERAEAFEDAIAAEQESQAARTAWAGLRNAHVGMLTRCRLARASAALVQ